MKFKHLVRRKKKRLAVCGILSFSYILHIYLVSAFFYACIIRYAAADIHIYYTHKSMLPTEKAHENSRFTRPYL